MQTDYPLTVLGIGLAQNGSVWHEPSHTELKLVKEAKTWTEPLNRQKQFKNGLMIRFKAWAKPMPIPSYKPHRSMWVSGFTIMSELD